MKIKFVFILYLITLDPSLSITISTIVPEST